MRCLRTRTGGVRGLDKSKNPRLAWACRCPSGANLTRARTRFYGVTLSKRRSVAPRIALCQGRTQNFAIHCIPTAPERLHERTNTFEQRIGIISRKGVRCSTGHGGQEYAPLLSTGMPCARSFSFTLLHAGSSNGRQSSATQSCASDGVLCVQCQVCWR